MKIPPYPKFDGGALDMFRQREWMRLVLRLMLEEAEHLLHWSGYASEYFQKKQGLAKDIANLAKFRRALDEANK